MILIKIFYVFIFFFSGSAFSDNLIKSQDQLTYERYSEGENEQNIQFSSDDIVVDEKTKVMIATGNVLIISKDRKINAAAMMYKLYRQSYYSNR